MKALLIVDVQNDFMPGGALGIDGADNVIEVINQLQGDYDLVIASKDWHPSDHCSFEHTWPVHCVEHTKGAEFAPNLKVNKIAKVFHKGVLKHKEAYSAFDAKEGLEAYLHQQSVDEIHLVGVATDYCVKATALDGVRLGFKVVVLLEGCCAIGDKKEIVDQLVANKVRVVNQHQG